jgi:hypothetical protein
MAVFSPVAARCGAGLGQRSGLRKFPGCEHAALAHDAELGQLLFREHLVQVAPFHHPQIAGGLQFVGQSRVAQGGVCSAGVCWRVLGNIALDSFASTELLKQFCRIFGSLSELTSVWPSLVVVATVEKVAGSFH